MAHVVTTPGKPKEVRATARTIDARTACFAAASLCAIAALAQPTWPVNTAPRLRIALVDVSASVADKGLGVRRREALFQGLGRSDRVAVVVFGETARVMTRAAASPDEIDVPPPAVGAHASDLAAALRSASALLREHAAAAGGAGEVRVFTDARSTSSAADLRAALAELSRAGCVAFDMEPSVEAPLPSRATRLRGPGRAAVGAPLVLEAEGVIVEPRATLRLSRQGALDETRVLPQGPFRVRFDRVEDRAGSVRFEVQIDVAGAVPPASTDVVVAAPGRPLLVSSRAAPPVAAGELRAAATLTADAFARDPSAALAPVDVVVLDGVSDAALDDGVVVALERHVEGGGGLVLFGGEHAFGGGGWAGRAIERVSPLVCRPKDDEGQFLYTAIDGSASMELAWDVAARNGSDAPSGTRTTLDRSARDAAHALVDGAAYDTTLVLRRFSGSLLPTDSPPRALRLDAEGRSAAHAAVRAFPAAAGATALLPPLREALDLCNARKGRRCGALFLTDGQISDDPAAVRDAFRGLLAAGVHVTVVALRTGAFDTADTALGRALMGTGISAVTAVDAAVLARVFHEAEAERRATGDDFAPGDLVSPSDAQGPFARAGAPPRIDRANRVHAADGARVVLSARSGEPLAALLERGRGHVSAWATSPFDAAWCAPSPATAAWAEALIDAVTPPPGDVPLLDLERDGLLRVVPRGRGTPASVRCFDGSGPVAELQLSPDTDGTLSARATAATLAGAVRASVVGADGRVLGTFGLDRPAPPEYQGPLPLDPEALRTAAVGAAPAEGGAALAPVLLAVACMLVVTGFAAAAANARRVKSNGGGVR